MWRPENWKNPFNQAAIKVIGSDDKPISHYEACEYGADAILEALRELGNSRGGREENEYRVGTWIFIPDEEVVMK